MGWQDLTKLAHSGLPQCPEVRPNNQGARAYHNKTTFSGCKPPMEFVIGPDTRPTRPRCRSQSPSPEDLRLPRATMKKNPCPPYVAGKLNHRSVALTVPHQRPLSPKRKFQPAQNHPTANAPNAPSQPIRVHRPAAPCPCPCCSRGARRPHDVAVHLLAARRCPVLVQAALRLGTLVGAAVGLHGLQPVVDGLRREQQGHQG